VAEEIEEGVGERGEKVDEKMDEMTGGKIGEERC
jgi:hypothetical protein